MTDDRDARLPDSWKTGTCCKHADTRWPRRHSYACPVITAWAEEMVTNRPEGRIDLPNLEYPYEFTVKQEHTIKVDPIGFILDNLKEWEAFMANPPKGGYEGEEFKDFISAWVLERIDSPHMHEGSHYRPHLESRSDDPEVEDTYDSRSFELTVEQITEAIANRPPTEHEAMDAVANQLPMPAPQPTPGSQLLHDLNIAGAYPDQIHALIAPLIDETAEDARVARLRQAEASSISGVRGQLEFLLPWIGVDRARELLTPVLEPSDG